MQLSMEYCAEHYRRQWLTVERQLHFALNSRDADAVFSGLGDAVKFFMVARTLPRKYDVDRGAKRYEPLLHAFLQFHEQPLSQDHFVEHVDRFQRLIGSYYGGRSLISLSSKLLWLKHRDPFIIFDSRVRNALGVASSSYPQFVERWLSGFEVHKSEIAYASDRLPHTAAHLDAEAEDVGPEAAAVSAELWFHRRVFDIYLWHLNSRGHS